MKIWTYILCFCCICSNLFAQTVTVSEQLSTRNDTSYDLIGQYDDQTLVFRDQITNFHVQAFDDDLKSSWEKELELDRRRPQVIGLIGDPETFSVVYTYRMRNRIHLKIHKYDAGANLIDSLTVTELGGTAFTFPIRIIRSENKQSLLMYYIERQERDHCFFI